MQTILVEPLKIEIYTELKTVRGEVGYPSNLRFLDLLNCRDEHNRQAGANYLDFVELDNGRPAATHSQINKAAIDLLAVLKADSARGMNARKKTSFIYKTARHVILRTPLYELYGLVYCEPGQQLNDLQRDRRPFLAMTDVTVMDVTGFRGERPFVAVNREQIIHLQDDPLFQISSLN